MGFHECVEPCAEDDEGPGHPGHLLEVQGAGDPDATEDCGESDWCAFRRLELLNANDLESKYKTTCLPGSVSAEDLNSASRRAPKNWPSSD
jgi:hypothetical protein